MSGAASTPEEVPTFKELRFLARRSGKAVIAQPWRATWWTCCCGWISRTATC